MDQESPYFELSDSGNFIRLTALELNHPDATELWDKNWIRVKIASKAGAFNGVFEGDFMTTDFETFKQQLRQLYDKLDGAANFDGYEDYVTIKVKGDGVGHIKAECILRESNFPLNQLTFDLEFDQTYLPNIIDQLNQITKQFPIIGGMSKLTNEY